jgi:hypothetical protein
MVGRDRPVKFKDANLMARDIVDVDDVLLDVSSFYTFGGQRYGVLFLGPGRAGKQRRQDASAEYYDR